MFLVGASGLRIILKTTSLFFGFAEASNIVTGFRITPKNLMPSFLDVSMLYKG
jgi:hypothetical protein